MARILVVDDMASDAKQIRFVLAAAGHEVRTAGDADSALAALISFPAELVLTDVQLPGIDGYLLARLILGDPARAGTVVVAISAHHGPDAEERARTAGCAGLLTKPIDTRSFLATLERFLPRAR